MKIIHTSDWHLGQVLYNYDRTGEQTDVMAQIADVVRAEQPDALLVSGDVFHTPAPSAATVRLYVNAMLAMRRACPSMTMVVIAGNHDSASRLDSDRELWQMAGVHVVGTVERGDLAANIAARHLIPVCSPDGTAIGTVVAVPHSYRLPREDFYAHLLSLCDRRVPTVLMAHLTMSGSDLTGHSSVGTLDSVEADRVAGYDYVALGHIHRPQTLAGSEGRVRYCGTPLAVSFDERCEHSVSVVTVDGHGTPQVRTIAIRNPRPLHTIPPGEPLPLAEALAQVGAYPDRNPCYIRLNVLLNDPLPNDAYEWASQRCAARGYRFCTIRTTVPHADLEPEAGHLSMERFMELSPLDVARQYVLAHQGRDLTGNETRMIEQTLTEIDEEEHA